MSRELLAGRYELLDLVGSGGQGEVYRAKDHWDSSTVALKLLADGTTGEDIAVWAELNHPNIVKVLDVGFTNRKPYIALEYVRGPTLREAYISGGEPILLSLAADICLALQTVHSRGICHGDLKPANILVEAGPRDSPRAKITDFGLWRLAGAKSAGFSGTLSYAAPEILKGEAPDQRSDLYSLGSCLHEVITGKPVFERESLRGAVRAHLKENPTDPRELNPSISDTLATVILSLLAKEPMQRISSAGEVLDRLGLGRESALPGEPAWVGRKRQLRFIQRLEELASEGRGRLALEVGEDGIGKSALLERVYLRWGINGGSKLRLRCGEGQPARDPTEELLRGAYAMADIRENAGSMCEPGIAAKRFIDSCRALTDEKPMLVALEDIGRADVSFLRFLGALAPLVASERILVVASVDGRGLQALRAEIPDLHALPHVRRITFRSFTREETKQLVASQLSTDEVDSDVIELAHRSSGGNPGLACEIVKQLVIQDHLKRRDGMWITEALPDPEALSAAMTWVVENKLQSLDPIERRVLGTIALIGAQVPREVIKEIVQDSIPGLDMVLRTLVDQDLVIKAGDGLALRQKLLKKAAASVFTDEELVELHTRAGRAIQARWPDETSWAGIIAFHLAGSGRRVEAFEHVVRAADAALGEQRHARALRLFSQAETYLADTDDEQEFRVLKGQSTCQMRLWRWSSACDVIARQLASPSAQGLEVDEHAMMELSYAKALAAQGNGEEASRHLEVVLNSQGLSQAVHLEALAASAQVAAEGRRWKEAEEHARLCLGQFVDIPDHPLRRPVENTLGVALLMSGGLEEAQIHLETSYRLREKAGDTIDAARCAMNLGLLFRRLGQYADARRWLDASLLRFELVGATALEAQALNTQGQLELSSGFPRKATILFRKAIRLALGCGRWPTAGLALGNLGLSLRESGEMKQAVKRFQEAMTFARRKRIHSLLGSTANNLGDCFLEAGDLEMAEGWYTEARTVGQKSDNPQYLGICMRGFARLHREKGELEQADRCLDKAMSALERSGNERSLLHTRCELAELRLAQGRTDEALLAAETAARKLGEAAPIDEAKVFRLLGKTKAHSGRLEEAAQAFRQCLDLVEATESLEGIALARLEVGRWLVRNGPAPGFRAAERYLSQAKQGFQRMGARLRVEEAEKLLKELVTTPAAGLSLPVDDAQKLASLYRMVAMVNSAKTSGGLLEQVLDLALHAVRGERGLVILVDRTTQKLLVKAKTEVDNGTIADARRISETVVRDVAGAGESVFSPDALRDARFSEYESIHLNRIACFMCVPLTLREEILGTIYVDSCSLERPFSDQDVSYLRAFAHQAAIAMENMRLREELERENVQLRQQLEAKSAFGTLVGRSPQMETVYKAMNTVAQSPVTVVIQGETGTGKEVIASAIHCNGPRSKDKFVPVNCAALPDSLLESELFGYVKGAFTGAMKNSPGLFQLADGGTIFLDEIGDMSPNLQARLLRVLQTGEVKRLGRAEAQHVDVRVIAATNKDLEKEVRAGRFREDLYYRLKVVTINIPPLRERREDIPLLAAHFLEKTNKRLGKQVRAFSDDAMAYLCTRQWPGNVRELEHIVEAAVALCPRRVIDADTLRTASGTPGFDTATSPSETGMTLREAQQALEKRYVQEALQACRWNVTRAAKRIGLARQQVHRIMRRHGIEQP